MAALSDLNRMVQAKGTAGYQAVVDEFISATEAIDFVALHKPYLHLIPASPARILDVGAGAGRDAAALAAMGHQVVAVEPLRDFLRVAQSRHKSKAIQWLADSLPDLTNLNSQYGPFDFILVSAVWHHLQESERKPAMKRLATLTTTGGILALSLRNGPAGAGIHNFPTDCKQTIKLAERHGFELVSRVTNEPSLIQGKPGVTWSKLAFKRR